MKKLSFLLLFLQLGVLMIRDRVFLHDLPVPDFNHQYDETML